MEIKGGGGYFNTRIYELPQSVVWQMAVTAAPLAGFEYDSRDDENCLLSGEMGKRVFSVSVQKMGSDTCQVIVDVHKKIIQVYNLRPEDKETKAFYKLLEQKIWEYSNYVVCPSCGKKISSDVRFCPECGFKVK